MADNNNPVILDGNKVNITIRDPNAPKPQMQGTVKRIPKKQSTGTKLMHAFLGPNVDNPGDYILNEYLVPTGKRMLNNAGQTVLRKISEGIQMLLFGRVSNNGSNQYWDRPSFDGGAQPDRPMAYKVLDAVETFAFTSRNDAEMALSEMRGRIQTYGSVSVLDYFEILRIPIKSDIDYIQKDRGWVNLDSARVISSTEGFVIDLPKPISLRR